MFSVINPMLANKCISSGSGASNMISCSPLQQKAFANDDCSGTPATTQDVESCNQVSGDPNPLSGKVACETFADNRVASVSIGAGCGEDGKLTSVTANSVTIIDRCNRSNTDGGSYKLVVGDNDELILTVFSDVTKSCEGESTTTTIKVGECKQIPGTVMGITGGDIFVTIDAAVEGTKLGNNAMTESVNLLAFVIAMIGAMVTMA